MWAVRIDAMSRTAIIARLMRVDTPPAARVELRAEYKKRYGPAALVAMLKKFPENSA